MSNPIDLKRSIGGFQSSKEVDKDVDSDNLELQDLRKKRFDEDTGHRSSLIIWCKRTISIYLGVVAFLLLINNSSIPLLCINLSDTVLVTILATTTANIIGMMIIVLNGLFKTEK